MSTETRAPIDLGNLAFLIKELMRQVEALDEQERESLEILLDDETMAALEESDQNRIHVSRAEVFGDAV
jgi:hypothetical protein